MPGANRRECQVPGCSLGEGGGPYKTFEGLAPQGNVLKDLELYIMMTHNTSVAVNLTILCCVYFYNCVLVYSVTFITVCVDQIQLVYHNS